MMSRGLKLALSRILACAFLGTASVGALAYDWTDGFDLSKREGDRYKVIFSPFTHHFNYSEDHKNVWLIGVDREREDRSLAGIAYFTNSFGQPSVYIYPWGYTFRGLLDTPQLYAKLTAGLLYGYRGKYEDNVPFNHNGFSPGIVPALGWETKDGYQAQLNLLGFAGLMLQFSLPIR